MTQGRFAALRHRDFRLLWLGRIPSLVGSQMQVIAINWHVFTLLRDVTWDVNVWGRSTQVDAQAIGLGMLGLVRIGPVIVFALLGGLMADTRDRRRILIGAQTVAMFTALVLALITIGGYVSLPLLYLLTAVERATYAFDEPAGQSIVPNLVPREDVANAVSLNAILWYVGTIVGPGIAGWMIARYSIGYVYLVNAISFMTVLVALLMMRYRAQRVLPLKIDWAALIDGARFTYGQKLIWSTMLIDFWATFFGSARTMLPLVAERLLGTGVAGYGLLATAQPVGALIAGAVLSVRSRIRQQGKVLLGSVVVYGVATALFGLSTVFALSYVLFALTGAGDTVSTVIRGTIRQLQTPDELRGRMTGVNMLFFMGGPQLGEVEAGAVAALLGVPFAIVSGGVATIAITMWLAWRYPLLRHYDE